METGSRLCLRSLGNENPPGSIEDLSCRLSGSFSLGGKFTVDKKGGESSHIAFTFVLRDTKPTHTK
jgi:hypothetical protein